MKHDSRETRQLTFAVNDQTLELIEQLKKEFNVGTKADVIRRALALARLATQNASPDHRFQFLDKNGEKDSIIIGG